MEQEDDLSTIIPRLWDGRTMLTPERPLLSTLDQVWSNAIYPNDIRAYAKMLRIFLSPSSPSDTLLTKLGCVHFLEIRQKRILMVGLTNDDSNVYNYLSESLHGTFDSPIDVFLHYPYTKNKVDHSVLQSYHANQLVTQSASFPNARFHFTDLRFEPFEQETPLQFRSRIELFAAFADYLQDGDMLSFYNRFSPAFLVSESLWIDALLMLQGKIMSSYAKSELEKPITDQLVKWYGERVNQHQSILKKLKKKINLMPLPEEAAAVYTEYMNQINQMYQHINELYTVLRIFRTFTNVPNQLSESPKQCIIILPMHMIHTITDMMLTTICKTECKSMEIEGPVSTKKLTEFVKQSFAMQ